jgi:hypothetical protein
LLALFDIRKDTIGLTHGLELLGSLVIPRIHIRVIALGEPAVGLPNGIGVGIF